MLTCTSKLCKKPLSSQSQLNSKPPTKPAHPSKQDMANSPDPLFNDLNSLRELGKFTLMILKVFFEEHEQEGVVPPPETDGHIQWLNLVLDRYMLALLNVVKRHQALTNLPAYISATVDPTDDYFVLDKEIINDEEEYGAQDSNHSPLMKKMRKGLIYFLRRMLEDLKGRRGEDDEEAEQSKNQGEEDGSISFKDIESFVIGCANDILGYVQKMADVVRLHLNPKKAYKSEPQEFAIGS